MLLPCKGGTWVNSFCIVDYSVRLWEITINHGFILAFFCLLSYLVNSCSSQEKGNLKEVVGVRKASPRQKRQQGGMCWENEMDASEPAWFIWKLRRTHDAPGRQQPLGSKQHSLWPWEVTDLVVVSTATAHLCQTSHHPALLLGPSGEFRWTRSCEQRDRSKCPAGEFSSRFPCTEGSPQFHFLPKYSVACKYMSELIQV